jgi:mono/diheme cytochrome c family protein
MRTRRRVVPLLVLLGLPALSLGSCASSSPPATPATAAGLPPAAESATEAAPGTTAVGPPEVAWSAMTFEQRKTYMKTTVFPKAKELFTALDPVRYANFTCATCHGDGAAEGKFKMPNPKLPKLPATSDGFKRLMAEKPKIMEFMSKQLKPTMATLLGEPEWTPETKTGFGCMECHTTRTGP